MRESLKAFAVVKKDDKNLRAVELGVMEGKNSNIIFHTLNGQLDTLYLIDSWKQSYRPEMHDKLLKTVQLFEDNKKVTIIRQESLFCLDLFPDNSLDYVYIDDAHNYSHVLTEIREWYSKVKPGGMIAGHDINLNKPERVLQAVIDFCKEKGLEYKTCPNDNEQVGDWWIWKS